MPICVVPRTQKDKDYMTDTTNSGDGVKRQQKVESLSRAERRDRNRAVALDLAERGFIVLPVSVKVTTDSQTGETKRSMSLPHRWQKRGITPPEEIAREWERNPDAVPGLRTGVSFDVIDLDRKDGKDGVAELESLGCSLGDFDCIVRTPTGGFHGYVKASGIRTCSNWKPGIDTRGSGGFVFAPGAVDKRGTYTTERGDLADVSIGLLREPPAALLRLVKPEPSADRGDAPPLPEVPLSKLQEALSYIPCDLPYDGWVRVLMGLHHGTGGSEQGRALALGWSAPYDGFDPKEVDAKWRSFGKSSQAVAVTARTVLAMAGSNGWRDTEHEAELDAMWDDAPEDGPPTLDHDLDYILYGPPERIEPGEVRHGFRLLTPDQCANLPPQPFLLEGLLGPQDVAAMVGQPGSGKSLLAPFIGYHVAKGRPVFGREVVQGRVLYLAAENERGLMDRIAALYREFGRCDDFITVAGVGDVRRAEKRLLKLVKEQKPALVVLDTFAAGFPGLKENEADQMSAAIAVLRKVQAAGPAVLLAAHGTKAGGNTLRGSGVADGALDVSIFIERSGTQDRKVTATKNRNGPDGDTGIRFSVGTRVIGTDSRGAEIRRPICEPIKAEANGPDLTPTEDKALKLIDSLGRNGVRLDDYHGQAAKPGAVSAAERERDRRSAARAALEALADKGVIEVEDGTISIPSFDPSGVDELWS